MSRRKLTYTARCSEPGCTESGFYEFDSQRELSASGVTNRPWLCVRHSRKDRVVTPERPRVEWWSEPVRETSYGKFVGGDGLLLSRQAYYADPKDFPVGTVFKITCEAIMPDSEK